MQEIEDARLLDRFADEATRKDAFEQIVRKYQEPIYWHVRKIVVDHDDANDVTQMVFIKVWKGLPGFRRESQLYSWIYRIATNECLSLLRTRRRRLMVSFEDVEETLSSNLAADPLFSGDKIQLKLQQAVLKLPPQQRIIFTMKYFDGLKYEAIAETLGISVGGAKASYHHAVKKIEKSVLAD
ncbi:MAG: hypothetical protein RL021_1019 [Bacteroidota bacterium]|jgi:RNA polymerase sigma-70 factor (ECF subfamily)